MPATATHLVAEARRETGEDSEAFIALMYHNVMPDGERFASISPSATSYFVTRAAFNDQLRAVATGGGFMDWAEGQIFYDRAKVPCPPAKTAPLRALVTFDDGWRDAVMEGGPILESHGAEALLFVTTGFLGKPGFLSRGELSRLPCTPFRVGSHAQTHRMLSCLPDREVQAELSDSRKLLEDLLGYVVDTLSIPSGAVDTRVRRIALECGYRFVFDSEVHLNRRGDSPSSIGRIAIMRNTGAEAFARYLQGRLGRERLRRAVLQAPKRILGLQRYEAFRRRLLGEKRRHQVTHQS